MSHNASRTPAGLQAERTLLSWDRTLLGIFGNGALLLLRHLDPSHLDRLAVLCAALLAVVACVLARRRRGRALLRMPRPRLGTARAEVLLLGGAVTLLGTAVLAFVLAEWAAA